MSPSKSQIRHILIVLGVAIILGAVTGFVSYRNERDQLMREAFSVLGLYRDLRKAALEDYMRSKASDIRGMARNDQVILALRRLRSAWSILNVNASPVVRRLYIDDNPFTFGRRKNLRSAGDGSIYTTVHQEVHDWAKRFLEHFGYYDLFLIDRSGNILYTVEKEDDFATNLKSGSYADSPLGYVFQRALRVSGENVVFSDYESYAPSKGAPALFAGIVVKGPDGQAVGVFAVQLAAEPINTILRFAEGMGRSGETYLVGNDLTMRSQSRFSTESTVLKTKIETPSVAEGLAGFEGAHVIRDYRGVPLLSSYSPIDFGGPPWVLLAEMDRSEVLSRLKIWPSLVAAMVAAIVGAFISHLFLGFFWAPAQEIRR